MIDWKERHAKEEMHMIIHYFNLSKIALHLCWIFKAIPVKTFACEFELNHDIT